LQACLSGTQYIYQGQEIGAVNAPKASYPAENYLDLDSYLFLDMVKERAGDFDKAFNALQHLARDHARIPMCWSKGTFGGFSDGAERAGKAVQEPWMKAHPLAGEINVASQLDDPDSVLAFWKKALRFRQEFADLLVYGDYKVLRPEDPDVFTFLKESPLDGSKAVVVLNFSTKETPWTAPDHELGLPEGKGATLVPIMSTHTGKRGQELAPFEGRVYLVT
jgi:alpha-glucosidase